mmetsp:Transcript_33128/g.105662  ORF Transcript_33128/g.105662 Transcript_33128/m.105662 type:complete len:208 (-) Transcript_33128:53-676(-)
MCCTRRCAAHETMGGRLESKSSMDTCRRLPATSLESEPVEVGSHRRRISSKAGKSSTRKDALTGVLEGRDRLGIPAGGSGLSGCGWLGVPAGRRGLSGQLGAGVQGAAGGWADAPLAPGRPSPAAPVIGAKRQPCTGGWSLPSVCTGGEGHTGACTSGTWQHGPCTAGERRSASRTAHAMFGGGGAFRKRQACDSNQTSPTGASAIG